MSPLETTKSVSEPKTDLCEDEVGVDFAATCTLESDGKTVHVVGSYEMYEGASDSCGGKELESTVSFDVRVGPGATSMTDAQLYHSDRLSTIALARGDLTRSRRGDRSSSSSSPWTMTKRPAQPTETFTASSSPRPRHDRRRGVARARVFAVERLSISRHAPNATRGSPTRHRGRQRAPGRGTPSPPR